MRKLLSNIKNKWNNFRENLHNVIEEYGDLEDILAEEYTKVRKEWLNKDNI